MKSMALDWQMILFVGGSMVQEFWLYYGLPRIYYCSVTQDVKDGIDKINAA